MTVRILNRAYRDLSEIWNYISADNRAAADALEDQLFAAIKRLGEEPGMGHVRADVHDPRYRFWRVGAYQIAYRIQGGQLTICRVVHSARNFRRLF
jgi:toxin ParE1/3/4